MNIDIKSSTEESQESWNRKYVFSLPGYLKIGEISCGLLCWILVLAGYFGSGNLAAYGFVLFVSITSWIFTTLLSGANVFCIGTKRCGSCSACDCFSTCAKKFWVVFEFIVNASASVLYIVGSCVCAAYAGGSVILITATVFSFLTTLVYFVDTYVARQAWRRSLSEEYGNEVSV